MFDFMAVSRNDAHCAISCSYQTGEIDVHELLRYIEKAVEGIRIDPTTLER
jgi:hypothetical protein